MLSDAEIPIYLTTGQATLIEFPGPFEPTVKSRRIKILIDRFGEHRKSLVVFISEHLPRDGYKEVFLLEDGTRVSLRFFSSVDSPSDEMVTIRRPCNSVKSKDKPKKITFPWLRPWRFWRAQDSSERYVLVEGHGLEMVPGASAARVTLFSGSGEILYVSGTFGTGYRVNTKSPRLANLEGIAEPLLELTSSPGPRGSDIRKQYYAFIDDSIALK